MKNKQTFDGLTGDILEELKKNSRMSYRNLAKKLQVSPASVIERMKRLEKEGVIKGYTVSLDLEKIGYDFRAIMQIAISQGHLIEVQKKISQIPGVLEVYDITGKYDSTVIIASKNRMEFNNLIKKISSVPNVERTNTSVVLNVIKDPLGSV